VGKEKRHKASLNSEHTRAHKDSLEALLAESRSLRQQMSDDLRQEARDIRRMSKRLRKPRRSTPSDEQSA